MYTATAATMTVSTMPMSSMQYAVVTCSEKNPADPETLSALAALGTKTYLTADGSITVTSTASGLQLRQA